MDWSSFLGSVGKLLGGREAIAKAYASQETQLIPPSSGLGKFLSSKYGGRTTSSRGKVAGFIGPVQPRGGSSMAYNIYGDTIPDEYGPTRRRRGRGITARDLRSFRRVANLIRKYAAPVRHFRTHPKRGH